jgi:hypothetical protein
VRPTHSVRKELAEFSKEQKERIAKLGRWQKKREEARLMHNIEAEEKGYCEVPPWQTFKEEHFHCQICGDKVGMTNQKDSTGLSWKRARRDCPAK